MTARRFDASYHEEIVLRDGTRVELRPVHPEDKPLFVEGFTRLSPESRYMRFFTGKDHLNAQELRYLTEVDGENHFALGAVAGERAMGVARFVRLRDEPEVAELAVTVVDEAQRKGLGRVLCERLFEAARERGVQRFRAEMLAANGAMRALLDAQVATTVERDEGVSLVIDFALPAAPAAAPPSNLLTELLALAGRRLLSFRRTFERLGS